MTDSGNKRGTSDGASSTHKQTRHSKVALGENRTSPNSTKPGLPASIPPQAATTGSPRGVAVPTIFDKLFNKMFKRSPSRASSNAGSGITYMSSVLDVTGMQRWANWRTRVNHGMTEMAINPFFDDVTPADQPVAIIDKRTCDFVLHHAVDSHGKVENINLDAENYVSFGIPRARRRTLPTSSNMYLPGYNRSAISSPSHYTSVSQQWRPGRGDEDIYTRVPQRRKKLLPKPSKNSSGEATTSEDENGNHGNKKLEAQRRLLRIEIPLNYEHRKDTRNIQLGKRGTGNFQLYPSGYRRYKHQPEDYYERSPVRRPESVYATPQHYLNNGNLESITVQAQLW